MRAFQPLSAHHYIHLGSGVRVYLDGCICRFGLRCGHCHPRGQSPQLTPSMAWHCSRHMLGPEAPFPAIQSSRQSAAAAPKPQHAPPLLPFSLLVCLLLLTLRLRPSSIPHQHQEGAVPQLVCIRRGIHQAICVHAARVPLRYRCLKRVCRWHEKCPSPISTVQSNLSV